MRQRKTLIAVLVTMALVCATVASLARAELTASGDLFVRFSGGITPDSLPRHTRAPIAVRIAGTVKTLSGARPPALRRISIAINSGGRLDARGLPVCRQSQIEPSTTEEALAVCGASLVGDGSYAADIAFPEQRPFDARGRVLAFNTEIGGHRAILAHIYASQPVPITRIIVFHIREGGDTFGTVLTGALPQSLIRWGYLKQISLDLHRDFIYRGRHRSYLSAACKAPAGFPGAVFPFAHASMGFADGRTLSSTLTRTCRVRGG